MSVGTYRGALPPHWPYWSRPPTDALVARPPHAPGQLPEEVSLVVRADRQIGHVDVDARQGAGRFEVHVYEAPAAVYCALRGPRLALGGAVRVRPGSQTDRAVNAAATAPSVRAVPPGDGSPHGGFAYAFDAPWPGVYRFVYALA